MIKIAICENDQKELSSLLSLIDEYRAATNVTPEIRCSSFLSGAQLIEIAEQGAEFDIVFFDILMPGMNGIDAAKELRQMGCGATIVFLSVSKDFALDAYSVKAYDYLLKPLARERLFSLLDEIINESSNQAKQYIVLNRSSRLTKILFKKIKYIEVIQKRLYFHINDGTTIETIGTISSVEETLLTDPRFLKPHRSYIVNMDYIDTIHSKEICMLDQAKIPVPKAAFTNIKEKFINYCVASE